MSLDRARHGLTDILIDPVDRVRRCMCDTIRKVLNEIEVLLVRVVDHVVLPVFNLIRLGAQ